MKTLKAFTTGLFCALGIWMGAVNAQDGGLTTQERTPGDFIGIECSSPVNFYISQSDNNRISIEAPADAMDKIKAEVKNNVLSFKVDIKEFKDIKIHIYAKDLQSIVVSGAASLEGEGTIKTNELKLEADGASDVKLAVEVENLKSELSGAATVNLSGSAQKHESEVIGAANLNAKDLKTQKTDIEVSGAASAKIDAVEELDAEISGAATLSNKSNPEKNQIDESGAGKMLNDTTCVRWGDKNMMVFNNDRHMGPRHGNHGPGVITRQGVNPQWMGLELGINSYMNSSFGFDSPAGYSYLSPDAGRSFSVGLNFFEYGVPLVKNYMTLVTGLGFEFNHYSFRNNYVLQPDSSTVSAINSLTDFDKNRLYVSWFRVPLLLQFNSKASKKGGSFHFSMGVIGAIKMCSNTQQTWKIGDSKYKVKTKDDFNLSPFKADATVRIGYGYLNLFVNYSLTGMFRNNEGPKLFPVSAGITLLNF